MRIWSIHPKYLDSKGLVACWRETLLAKKVIRNKTKGYRNHSQLLRFKSSAAPLDCINLYLQEIFHEAERRNYSFNKKKIDWKVASASLTVTAGQLEYEIEHLKNKLAVRDPKKLREIKSMKSIEAHPLFRIVEGKVETWEIIK